MMIKVVIKKRTLNRMWADSDPNRGFDASGVPLGPDEVIVELDEEVIARILQIADQPTFDAAVHHLLLNPPYQDTEGSS